MRIPVYRFNQVEVDPHDPAFPALHEMTSVWHALISSIKQFINSNILTNYLSGSRTPGTMNLCATASARRLCGN
jgi:hypothetical protein